MDQKDAVGVDGYLRTDQFLDHLTVIIKEEVISDHFLMLHMIPKRWLNTVGFRAFRGGTGLG